MILPNILLPYLSIHFFPVLHMKAFDDDMIKTIFGVQYYQILPVDALAARFRGFHTMVFTRPRLKTTNLVIKQQK